MCAFKSGKGVFFFVRCVLKLNGAPLRDQTKEVEGSASDLHLNSGLSLHHTFFFF